MGTITVIDREDVEHSVEARAGLTLMEILRELDYGVTAICGGMCSCATCHVYIDPAWQERLPTRQSDEKELVSELTGCRENSRLSCQIEFREEFSGLKLTLAPEE